MASSGPPKAPSSVTKGAGIQTDGAFVRHQVIIVRHKGTEMAVV
jgi:hypothetical protein